MKGKNTATFQAYGPESLRAFLEEDMKRHGYKHFSQEIIHALTEYAKSHGYVEVKEVENRRLGKTWQMPFSIRLINNMTTEQLFNVAIAKILKGLYQCVTSLLRLIFCR